MSAKKKITILLADDHLVVRMGISTLLSLEPDLEVVGEAESGSEAVGKTLSLRPDVVLMDVMMPSMNGAEATEAILRKSPETRILLLTSFGGTPEVRRALDAGAVGALSKTASRAEIVSAIHTATVDAPVINDVIRHQLDRIRPEPGLTPRQREVLNLVARGFNNREIGRLLGTGEDAIKKHLKNIYTIINVSNRAEAASYVTSGQRIGFS